MTSGPGRPPRLVRALVERLLDARDREFLLADLDEEFGARRGGGAVFWYVAQAVHAAWTRRMDRSATERAGGATRRGASMLNALWGDVMSGARSFRKQPGAVATIILSLTLGIGAATAMFSVVRAVLLAPLPYGHPEGLVTIWMRWTGYDRTWLSDQEVLDFRHVSHTLAAVGAWDTTRTTITGAGDAVMVGSARVTANLFDVLDVRPIVGRTFTEAEAQAQGGDTPTLVVLGYGLWQRQFGGDPSVTARYLQIDGRPARILGVMPRGFQLPTDYGEDAALPSQLWTPMYFDPAHTERGSHNYYAAARLAPGATARQASDDLAALMATFVRQGLYSPTRHFTAFAVPVTQDILGGVQPALVTLVVAVGFLMLMACTNAAALLVARTDSRQREFATRAALGASRWRLGRQHLVESLLLAFTAGAAGLALAPAAKRALEALGPTAIPRAAEVSTDWRVGLFMAGLSVIAAVLCSLPSTARVLRVSLVDGLKDGSAQASTGRRRSRLRSALVVTELAFAVLLLTGTGLTLRSLWSLERIDLGFRPAGVLTARIALPDHPYDTPARIVDFNARLLTKVRALPGVEHAGLIRSLPIGNAIGDWGLQIEHAAQPDGSFAGGGSFVPGDWQVATDGALEALGERLVRGRFFTADDRMDTQPVALINETMANRYWPTEDALGRRFRMSAGQVSPWTTVVGIVADVRHNGVAAPIRPKFYRPYAQFSQAIGLVPPRGGTLVVRTTGDPLALAGPLQVAARGVDPNVPLTAIRPMEDVVDTALTSPRLAGSVFSAFAGVAVLLSAIGIYGLLVFMVGQRAQEVGIRVAIGAAPRQIVRLFLGHGLRLAAIGIGTGLVLAAFWTRTLAGVLYGVPPLDPETFVTVPIVLLAVALAACVIPARRAALVDPVAALKT
jgi:putative ABC transport system permease protein